MEYFVVGYMLVLGPHALMKPSSNSNLRFITACDTVDIT